MSTLLLATESGDVVHRQPIDPKWAYSVGRSTRCDIVLQPGSISRRHALLFHHAGVWWVADTGSNSGLATEDGITRCAPLTPERWVRMGPVVAWLLEAGAPAKQKSSSERPAAGGTSELDALTHLAGSSAGEGGGDGGEGVAGDSGTGSPNEFFVIQSADGGLVRLLDGTGAEHATIGTDPACTIHLPQEAADTPGASESPLAPLHAVLYREPSSWVLIAAHGAVTTNGKRFLRSRVSTTVAIELGGYRLRSILPEPLRDGAPERPQSTNEILAGLPRGGGAAKPAIPAAVRPNVSARRDE
ncbi:MAG: FHA domain-containing protein [Phycisphaerae bacterium]|nr:FHA domain-containing protein [Phycisphaerae bacterium]